MRLESSGVTEYFVLGDTFIWEGEGGQEDCIAMMGAQKKSNGGGGGMGWGRMV